MTAPEKPRRYRKRKRAESEHQTRQRITEAAVELHGTVGPANTTVTDIANLAGVSRMTVYNHFPTDVELFQACSSHWASENPFPDPGSWTGEDPAERLHRALCELYPWYRGRQQMLGNVIRDTPNVPALAEVMGPLWESYMGAVVQALVEGWSNTHVDAKAATAMLRLAVDFSSWSTLTGSGVRDDDAAILMARMVSCVLAGEPSAGS
jgi:AcrR family transcriptional regulator